MFYSAAKKQMPPWKFGHNTQKVFITNVCQENVGPSEIPPIVGGSKHGREDKIERMMVEKNDQINW